MKHQLQDLLGYSIAQLCEVGELSVQSPPSIHVERSRDQRHGDFASPVALALARSVGRKPRDIAEAIVARLPDSELVAKVELAGPGFINFFMTQAAFQDVVRQVLEAGDTYGRSAFGAGRQILVEFVSANPTGPLHVGHGRHAAFGAGVANLLEAIGYDVSREYYVNNAGRQMDILATSVWIRHLECYGEIVTFPVNGYRGEYVVRLAESIPAEHRQALVLSANDVSANLPPDESQGGDKDTHIDALIAKTKSLLGERYAIVFEHASRTMVEEIRQDLERFGVSFDRWYHESSLVESGAVQRTIERLRAAGCLYEQDGALWFRSTEFGDEKDRVLIRENGQATYVTNDIAYHLDKLERGIERLIDVLGADHHGYVPRMRAAIEALGEDPNRLEVLIMQFANLYRGGEKVQMSTRSGEFVTLEELCKEVGRDAARFFYVMRKNDQHLDFDLDLAASRSNENPVYYVQYAHARVCSLMRQLVDRGYAWNPGAELSVARLVETQESSLLKTLSRFPEVVEAAGLAREPHQIAFYLRELANDFHAQYNAHQFLVEDETLRDARISLAAAARQVLGNGLRLLGVSAPESM